MVIMVGDCDMRLQPGKILLFPSYGFVFSNNLGCTRIEIDVFFHAQVMTYVQLLWEQVIKEDTGSSTLYNGSVEAVYTLLSEFE